MSARPVLILAGGTGGHVYPALEVARVLGQRMIPVHWLGGGSGIETRLVPAAGIPFIALPGRGIRGTGVLNRLVALPRLVFAVIRAGGIIRCLQPRVVIGFGGYASGAGGLAARLAGYPLVVHEQNAVAGLTNRVLARLGARLLQGFPGAFARDAELTGNPVRESISRIAPPGKRMHGRRGPLRLLVMGGSQGAQALNEVVPAALAMIVPAFEVLHLAGAAQAEATVQRYREAGVGARVRAYESDMSSAYAWADLAIARAGALTLAELCAAGLAAILVPYPTAADDHQSANAEVLVAARAARVLPQSRLTPAALAALLRELTDDAGERKRLITMAGHARDLAGPHAGEKVALAVLAVAGEAGR